MSQKPRLTGRPIMRILSEKSGKLVGFLYEWDNGDREPTWIDRKVRNVSYEPMGEAA